MRMTEFAKTYCQDLLDKFEHHKQFDMFENYPYDEIIYDEDDNTPIRVVNTSSSQIPIADILGMERDDFARVYPDEESLTAYDKYMAMFLFLEGEEAVHQIRNAMMLEAQRLENYQVPGSGVDI